MKTTFALVLLSALSATAFVPAYQRTQTSHLSAKSKEEDIELTRKVIADFFGTSEDEAPAKAPAPAPAAADDEAPKKKGKKGKK